VTTASNRILHAVGGASARCVSLNTSQDEPAVLCKPSWADLEEAISAFEAEVYRCAVGVLTTRRCELLGDRLSEASRDQPIYFSGEMTSARLSAPEARRIVFTVADSAVLRSAAGLPIGGPRHLSRVESPNTLVLSLPWSERVAVVRRALGPNLQSLRKSMSPRGAAEIGLDIPDFRAVLHKAASPTLMIVDLLSGRLPSRASSEIAPSSRSRNGPGAFWPLLFMSHLRLLGIALPPLRVRYLQLWRHRLARRFASLAFTPPQAAIMEDVEHWVSRLSEKNRAITLQIFQSLLLASDLHGPEDLNTPLFLSYLGSLMAGRASPSYAAKASTLAGLAFTRIVHIWNGANPDRPIVGHLDENSWLTHPSPPTRLPQQPRGPDRRGDPFWFIGDPASVPASLPDYRADGAGGAWATVFKELMPLLKVKDLAGHRTATRHWLRYVDGLTNPPRSVSEVVRSQHINDTLDSSQPTFRRYLAGLALAPATRNDILSAVGSLFALHLSSRGFDERLNPVRIDLDRFLGLVTRGKTPRTPLTPEGLARLRALNRRGEFAFSRSLMPSTHFRTVVSRMGHQRRVKSPNGPTLEWWPGLAVLLDLMLTLPLRGFQARWLDSGEGDEDELNIETLVERPNPLPTAIRGRRMGVFQAFPRGIATDGLLLGLRIATNKVPIDRDGRFGIPWCPDDLRDALSMLAQWQRRHNPISASIAADEHSWAPGIRSDEVNALVPRIFPLFRDPARLDGRPPTYQQVQTYWNQLCSAAEDEAKAEGIASTSRLTRDRRRETGNQIVHERVALHDLHSLRVSGITALIEAGMPPTMVQEIVGHATVVMTLYYHKVRPEQVNSALASAFMARERAVERLLAISDSGEDAADTLLFNLRPVDDAVGLAMLRAAIGNGSHQVLTHGICPGGDCRTGGEFSHSEKEHRPVPRAGACSLCRYRVSGPMFLAGLVINANKIMFELHTKGKELRELNDAIRARRRRDQASSAFAARREVLHRELEDLWAEWAAEHRYVQDSLRLLADLAAREQESTGLPVLVQGGLLENIGVQTERRHAFHLAQLLAEASAHAPSERHAGAIAERDAFLNEMLHNNDLSPFLLRLDGVSRLAAGNLLGQLVAGLIPDMELDSLRTGEPAPGRFEALKVGIAQIAHRAQQGAVTVNLPAFAGSP
jgi:hypothetical protein